MTDISKIYDKDNDVWYDIVGNKSNQNSFPTASGPNYDFLPCLKTWLYNNDKLRYSNQGGNPNSFNRVNKVNSMITEPLASSVVDGKYPIDCQSLVMICLMGIGFEESVFGDRSNTPKYPRAPINFLSDDFCKYTLIVGHGERKTLPDNISYRRLATWQFAEFLDSIGMYYHVGEGFSLDSLQPGDILFEGRDEYLPKLDGIFHAEFYVGKTHLDGVWVAESASSQDTYPVHIRHKSISTLKEKLVGYARIPLGYNNYGNVNDNIATFTSGNTSFKHTATLDAPAANWDLYEVTVKYTYKDANAIGNAFPAIDIGMWIYSRYDDDTMPNVEVNVPIVIKHIVCVNPEYHELTDDNITTLTATLYVPRDRSYTMTDSAGTTQIISVKALMRKNG